MTLKEEFKKWLENHKIQYAERQNCSVFVLGDQKTYLLIEEKEGKILDSGMCLILSEDEFNQSTTVDYFAFEFGGQFYYHPAKANKYEAGMSDEPMKKHFCSTQVEDLKLLLFVGKAEIKYKPAYTPLGIHGTYELLNGNSDYKFWCKKAQFLGIDALGLAEENTLAGTLVFQKACKESKIKPILGETVTVKIGIEFYKLKLYPINKEGWKQLIIINNIINVLSEGKHITQEQLMNQIDTKDLICVIPNDFPFIS